MSAYVGLSVSGLLVSSVLEFLVNLSKYPSQVKLPRVCLKGAADTSIHRLDHRCGVGRPEDCTELLTLKPLNVTPAAVNLNVCVWTCTHTCVHVCITHSAHARNTRHPNTCTRAPTNSHAHARTHACSGIHVVQGFITDTDMSGLDTP